jgi:triacylglycerol esterase/lipase EstA (alpha/beta hydrolase family)
MWSFRRLATVVLLAGSLTATAASPAGAVERTRVVDGVLAVTTSVLFPNADPLGANNWRCKPSAAHPRPVVLLHGTFLNSYGNWGMVAPELAADGYCVFALNYGDEHGIAVKGTAAVPESAKEVARFVDRVLAATGAEQVDIVGHSQGGGLLPRWYLKFEGGASKVHSLVGMAPSNHGTTVDGIGALAEQLGAWGLVAPVIGQAAADQQVGSEVNRKLDAGYDTVPGVTYTTIVSRYDEVVTPYTNQYLTAGPGAHVTNILLQNVCANEASEHVAVAYDPVAMRLVRNALDPAHARNPDCGLLPPALP